MPIREKCLVCGLDLLWINDDRLTNGGYVHLFTEEGASKYKAFHTPVPCLPDPPITENDVPARPCVALAGTDVDPRCSVAPKCKPVRVATQRDFDMVKTFLAAIFNAR